MSTYIEPMRGIFRKGSRAEHIARARTGRVIAPGFNPTPEHDLIFHGGKIIPDLVFTNLYIDNWDANDSNSIDTALQAAMSAPDLNIIVSQYFNHITITSAFKASQKQSVGLSQGDTFSQGDTEQLIQDLHSKGVFDEFNLSTTIFNLMLPRGVILTDDPDPRRESATKGSRQKAQRKRTQESATKTYRVVRTEPDLEEASSSLEGLGGYHGSVHIESGSDTVYYAIGVYSEQQDDGTVNGIPVFDKPWKNVVATFYHELNEARTDPDVEDAIRAGNTPDANRFLGWVSAQGEECGDFPVFEAHPLSRVFQEIDIPSSTVPVPIQFLYSNAVHGPEGPLVRPQPGPSAQNGQHGGF
jgi:hypothetical protein